jgi:serine/threonine-protein kinase
LRAELKTAERLFEPTAITSLPDPPSQNREAVAAYREGISSLRSANWSAAREAFERAASLDPSLGAAHLRVAVVSFWQKRDSARGALRKAILYRGRLSEKELAVLRVHEPLIQGDPPDFDEALRRLAVAVARFPGDADIRSMYQFFDGRILPEEVLVNLDRCLALDSEHADCWQTKGRLLVRLGRYDEALASVNRCLSIAPDSTDCLYERLTIQKLSGDCVSLEHQARAWIAGEPGSAGAYIELATALYGQGRPLVEVKASVEQAMERHERDGMSADGRMISFDFSLITGDFAGAEQCARSLEAESKDVQDERIHAWTTTRLVELLRETGREREASEKVKAFLVRRSVLLFHPHKDVWSDEMMFFWRSELAEGRISRREYEDARKSFLERWRSPTPDKRFAAWLMAYAFPARDRQDAEEALAAAPGIGTHDEHDVFGTEKTRAAWLHGRLRWLAGDPAGALPDLLVAISDCNALGDPMRHTIAQYYIGTAREAIGDREGACAAYGLVLSRWGKITASRTARGAAERATVLGCGVAGP